MMEERERGEGCDGGEGVRVGVMAVPVKDG